MNPIDWSNSSVMITGGTGSFGRKIAEIMLREYRPKKLIVFSRDELRQEEMQLHGFAVAGRQHQGCAGAALGAYGAEQIGRLGALIVRGAGTRAPPGPAVGQLVLLADSHLVLEPHLYRGVGGELVADFRHALGEVFLNASTASASCR